MNSSEPPPSQVISPSACGSAPGPSNSSEARNSGIGGTRLDHTTKLSMSIWPAFLVMMLPMPQNSAAAMVISSGTSAAPSSRSSPMTPIPAKATAAPSELEQARPLAEEQRRRARW